MNKKGYLPRRNTRYTNTRANQRAFYDVQEMQNPRDIAIGAGSHNLLESAPCTRSPAINTLISTADTVRK